MVIQHRSAMLRVLTFLQRPPNHSPSLRFHRSLDFAMLLGDLDIVVGAFQYEHVDSHMKCFVIGPYMSTLTLADNEDGDGNIAAI